MTDLLLGLILAAAVGYGLWHFKRTLQSGGSCCSSGAAPVKKTGTRGKRKKTYPFRYLATVEGMHCGNCATRVENAFNAKEDYWAAVDLGKKQLHLQSTKPVTEEVVAAAVADAGYTLLDFMPETG